MTIHLPLICDAKTVAAELSDGLDIVENSIVLDFARARIVSQEFCDELVKRLVQDRAVEVTFLRPAGIARDFLFTAARHRGVADRVKIRP